jgi:hypothetical protein
MLNIDRSRAAILNEPKSKLLAPIIGKDSSVAVTRGLNALTTPRKLR